MSTNYIEFVRREIVAHHEAIRRQVERERLARMAHRQRPRVTLRGPAGTAGRIVACWLAPAGAPALPE